MPAVASLSTCSVAPGGPSGLLQACVTDHSIGFTEYGNESRDHGKDRHTHSEPTTITTCGMSAPLSLDEEARLYTTNAEREKYESLATLYGIVVALDYLERAYVRDSVTAAEYVVVLDPSAMH